MSDLLIRRKPPGRLRACTADKDNSVSESDETPSALGRGPVLAVRATTQ